MKRRDLLKASALLRRYKMDPGDVAALGLAASFLADKEAGETELTFQEWLDEDIEEDDDDDIEGEEDSPTTE